jgi:hypothetical protein
MSGQLQLRRGTTAQNNTFTGAVGELTYNTDDGGLISHDGVTAGGYPGGGYLYAPGAVVTTVQAKLQETVSVKDFGAVGDGVTDNYAAITAAFSAMPVGGCLHFPSGNYVVAQQLVVPSSKRLSLIGEGARQSVITYTGTNTTNDCFVFGDGVTDCNGYLIQGIEFRSNTTMTGGAGVRFKRLTRSSLINVMFGHQDVSKNFYHGVWFDALDMVDMSSFQASAQQDCFRVNGGTGGVANLFLSNGKIQGGVVGIRIGGNFGGFYLESTDVINNGTNVLIDRTISNTSNRETFFGPGCYIDTADTTRTATTYNGICVDVQDTGGFIFFNNTWVATCGTGIRIGATFAGTVQVTGGIFLNCFTTYGGNGHAIQLLGTFANLIVNGTRFQTIEGTGVICSGGDTSNVILRSPVFTPTVASTLSASIKANINTKSQAIVTTSQYAYGKTVGGATVPIASATDNSPAHTYACGPAALGGSMNLPYYRDNAAATVLNLSKSRGVNVGDQTVITVNDVLGTVSYEGSDGTNFVSAVKTYAASTGVAAGIVSANYYIATKDNAGNLVESLVVQSDHNIRSGVDNTYSCGTGAYRWSEIYAGSGTINTSDGREKTSITGLSDVEKVVSQKLKGLIKKYQFTHAVQKKGADVARIHFGVIAQEVIATFKSEGLDALRYGIVCYDEWDEIPEIRDENNNVICKYKAAGNRYGIRYDELLVFIIASL